MNKEIFKESLLDLKAKSKAKSQSRETAEKQNGTSVVQEKMMDATRQFRKKTGIGRPKKDSQQTKLGNSEVARTVKIDRELYDKIIHIADSNIVNIKDIVNVALRNYVEKYEQKHGTITLRESNISAESLIR